MLPYDFWKSRLTACLVHDTEILLIAAGRNNYIYDLKAKNYHFVRQMPGLTSKSTGSKRPDLLPLCKFL